MPYSHKLVSAVQDKEMKTPEDWSVMVHTLDEFAFAVKRALRLGDRRDPAALALRGWRRVEMTPWTENRARPGS